jgi:cytochrome c oxidase accessory protein FixG
MMKAPDQLATIGEHGRRMKVYPADVKGKYRSRKNILYVILLAIFLSLPWIRIAGEPAVLFDLATRKFAIFGLLFWAHDAPMLFLVFGSVVMTIFFLTAVWGRFWCGWACPQTVFIDAVFRRIERIIEGDSVARKRRDSQGWNSDRIIRKSVKWALYSGASLILTHSFIAYFVGTERLAEMMKSTPSENWGTFLFMAASTAIILFNFGWFREQFCLVLCPYGRLQGVLMDPRTLLVGYDQTRGEPRRTSGSDCIDCKKCVQVCPTGIDIRNGTQFECIACAACVDACDSVMSKLKKPLGLVGYRTESGEKATAFRTRPLLYLGILTFLVSTLIFTVVTRKPVNITLIRNATLPYEIIPEDPEGRVRNTFHVDLHNQGFTPLRLNYTTDLSNVEGVLGSNSSLEGSAVILPVGAIVRLPFEARFAPNALNQGHGKLQVKFEATPLGQNPKQQHWTLIKEVPLVGPLR